MKKTAGRELTIGKCGYNIVAKGGSMKTNEMKVDRGQLIADNVKAAYSLCWKFARNQNDFDRLRDVAMDALIESAKSYDPNMDNKFITYAFGVIKGKLLNSISAVRNKELKNISLDMQIETEDGSVSLIDSIDSKEPTPYKIASDNELQSRVRKLLGNSNLNDKQKVAIEEYYGLNGEKKTLEEIADLLGCDIKNDAQKRCWTSAILQRGFEKLVRKNEAKELFESLK